MSRTCARARCAAHRRQVAREHHSHRRSLWRRRPVRRTARLGLLEALEYPRPIQDPNLWPDTQSTYFVGQLELPAGATLTLHGDYPHARYFEFALYKHERDTFVAIEALRGQEIEPDNGSTNPFLVGADRLAESRDFTLQVVAADPPADRDQRKKNTLYVGANGGLLQAVIREYLSDQGSDGAGWGPADAPASGHGMMTYEATLAEGTKLSAADVVTKLARPMEGATKQPRRVRPSSWPRRSA